MKATSSTSNDLMELRLASTNNTAEQRKGFIQRLGFYGKEEYTNNELLDASIDVVFGSNFYYPTYQGISSTQMTFSTRDFVGVYNERLRITATGNVGIGTSNPSSKLDVNGNINATSYTGSTIAGLSNMGMFASNLAVNTSNSLVSFSNYSTTNQTSLLNLISTQPNASFSVINATSNYTYGTAHINGKLDEQHSNIGFKCRSVEFKQFIKPFNEIGWCSNRWIVCICL
jgi:hypothetical protein